MSVVTKLKTVKTQVEVGYNVPIEVEINEDSGMIYDVQVEMRKRQLSLLISRRIYQESLTSA